MMKEIIYDKLVRDNIPSIIEKAGKECETEVLSQEKYVEALDKKLDEELMEYHKDKNAEELADLLEVVYAVAVARGYTREAIEDIRAKKAEERGGFQRKILLKKVIEK